MNLLLSTAYFAPIQYYSKLCSAENVFIEVYEHFPKQTYRNRCIIYSANGPLTLSIPVRKGSELKIYTKEVKIDYSSNWQKIHFKAIESAYRGSPYYEYYMDDLAPFFNQNFRFLLDYNNEILAKTAKIIGIPLNLSFTSEFQETIALNVQDLRFTMHPKTQKNFVDSSFTPPLYRQVFEPKSGFIENLSILDLLFNTGPDSIKHLRK